jgi:hypothetical protein
MQKTTIQQAFANPDLFCTSVAALMLDNFGSDYLTWEPETVEMELRSIGVDVTSSLMDKIMAVSVLLTTNTFHTSFQAWNNLCQTLNLDVASGDLFSPATLDDIVWGCMEARMLEGPEEYDVQGFTSDIAIYVGTMLGDLGITKPPSILKFAIQDEKEMERRDTVLSADETAFKTYWDNQNGTTGELEEYAVARAKEMLQQLKTLPLKNADNEIIEAIKA